MNTMKPQALYAALLAAAIAMLSASTARCAEGGVEEGASAREFYNAGTQKLREGKLTDAETYLQSAVASQDARIQPPALYNLGSVRFKDGVNELTNAPPQKEVEESAAQATNSASEASKALDQALAGDDLPALLAAYRRGRGARRELKAAMDAVKKALDTYGVVLTRWRRALGDFRGAAELKASDKDAQFNADATDRYIARLVDMMQPLSALRQGMGAQSEDLRKKMAQARGKLPNNGQDMGGGDGDEDDEGTKKPKDLGDGFEGPVRNGHRMELSRDEARRLLNMLRLDGDRKLSVGGMKEEHKPEDMHGKDW